MRIKAPYSFAAAVLVVTAVGVGALTRPHASVAPVPKIALSAAGGGNAAPSARVSPEGASAGRGVGTLGGSTLLERAYAGDARAQYHLGARMHECSTMRKLAERGYGNDVADACVRDEIPVGDWKPWHDKAIAVGDPVAVLAAAFESKDEAAMAAAMDLAARSGDPEAQILLGHHLLTVEGADTIDALAWMILGCGDCTIDDPILGFSACVEFGNCTPGVRFVDHLAAEHGGPEVQEAQARAEGLRAMYGVP